MNRNKREKQNETFIDQLLWFLIFISEFKKKKTRRKIREIDKIKLGMNEFLTNPIQFPEGKRGEHNSNNLSEMSLFCLVFVVFDILQRHLNVPKACFPIIRNKTSGRSLLDSKNLDKRKILNKFLQHFGS